MRCGTAFELEPVVRGVPARGSRRSLIWLVTSTLLLLVMLPFTRPFVTCPLSLLLSGGVPGAVLRADAGPVVIPADRTSHDGTVAEDSLNDDLSLPAPAAGVALAAAPLPTFAGTRVHSFVRTVTPALRL